MNDRVARILENKPEYKKYINFLDNLHYGKFSKKINSENNDINALSFLSEIELGHSLHHLFNDVKFEPNINGKTPDWLVNSFGEFLIFEVRKINPLEQDVNDTISSFKNGTYVGNPKRSFSFSNSDFQASMSKITAKEESYRNLIIKNGYKLFVYFDVVMLPNFCLTETDLKSLFNFDNPNFPLTNFPNFLSNVSGVLAKPNLGDKIFIPNLQSNHLIKIENLKILENFSQAGI